MTPRILITGGRGYLGSNLSKFLLAQGFFVNSLNRGRDHNNTLCDHQNIIHYYNYDGTTESVISCLRKCKPDIVFHFASRFIAEHDTTDVVDLIQSNILLGTQLLEAMTVSGVKYLINADTSWRFYHSTSYSPVNLYAATKQSFIDICKFYTEASDLSVINLIIFDTYGPKDMRGKLVSKLIDAAINEISIDLSPGEQKIDLVYVDDVCSAFVKAVDIFQSTTKIYRDYMITSSSPVTLRELVRVIEVVSDRKLHVNWGARPYRKREVMDSYIKFNLVEGWAPKVKLEDGINFILHEKNGVFNGSR